MPRTKATAANTLETPAQLPETAAMFDPTPPDALEPQADAPIDPVQPIEPPVDATQDAAQISSDGTADAPGPEEAPAPAAPEEPEMHPNDVAPVAADPAAPVTSVDTTAPKAPSAAPIEIRLGHVACVLHRVPLGVVLDLLEAFEERIAALRNSPSIADLQKRMRESEGRCAPVFFTQAGHDEIPLLFAGVEAVAAAINLDLSTLSVVTIDAGDAGAVQSFLADQARQRPATSEDDIIMRVNAHYDD